jgi:hypothetical protein
LWTAPPSCSLEQNPAQKFSFPFRRKNRRAQIKKFKENFFVGWRGFRATAGLTSLLGVLLKKCSNFVQETPLEVQKQLVAEAQKEEEIITANRRLIEIMERKIEEVLSNI